MKVEDNCACGSTFSYCTMFPVDRVVEYGMWLEAHEECRNIQNNKPVINTGGRRELDSKKCAVDDAPTIQMINLKHN